MKLNVLYVVIALTPVVCVAQHERRLEGCVDPRIIARLLAKMQHTNSPALSVIEIRFTREAAGLWKMYFLPGWYFVEPVKGPDPLKRPAKESPDATER